MTVKELIAKLQEVEDKDMDVCFSYENHILGQEVSSVLHEQTDGGVNYIELT